MPAPRGSASTPRSCDAATSFRADEMPYDCGTTSFGVTTVYDSGDFPALFDELLRRLHYERERAEQARVNAVVGARRGIGLAVYVEKTGLGPFETTHIEARPHRPVT